jgi:MFS family permease
VRLPAITKATERLRIVHRIAEGVRLAAAEPACRSAIVLIGVVALLASPFIALVPAMAIEGLHLGSGHRGSVGTSVLVTAQGIGAVTGALLLPGLAQRFGRAKQVVVALFALPVLLVAYGLAPGLWVGAVALLLVGLAYIAVLSGLNTVVQLRAPTAARGRVLSLFMLSLGTVYPIGAIVQGAIGARVGVREVTIGAAAGLLVVLAGVAARWPGMLRALGGTALSPLGPPPLPDPVGPSSAAGPDTAVDPDPA